MCRYLRYKNDEPTCAVNDSEVCPFKWWCTHDNIWKDYEGSKYCGLAAKNAKDSWFLVDRWDGDFAICKNGGGIEERILVKCEGSKRPYLIRSNGTEVFEMIFD